MTTEKNELIDDPQELIDALPYSRVIARPAVQKTIGNAAVLSSVFAIIPAIFLPADGYFAPIILKHKVQMRPLPKKDVHGLLWEVAARIPVRDGQLLLPETHLRIEAARMDTEILCNPERYVSESFDINNYSVAEEGLDSVPPGSAQ